MEQCTISVIISCLAPNEEDMEIAIQSVRSQTFEDFEVIIVVAGRKEKNNHILEEYTSLDTRIQVFQIETTDSLLAKNYGICMAHGDYIAFVDSDGYAAPWMLEDLINACISQKVDVAVGLCHTPAMRSQVMPRDKKVRRLSFPGLLNKVAESHEHKQKEYAVSIGPLAALYRRESLAGICFPDYVHDLSELAWALSVLKKAAHVAVLDECVYIKRHADHLDNGNYPYEIDARMKALEQIKELLPEGDPWFALRVLNGYAHGCECYMRTKSIRKARERLQMTEALSKDPVCSVFRAKRIGSNWSLHQRIKRLLAITGLLPIAYFYRHILAGEEETE